MEEEKNNHDQEINNEANKMIYRRPFYLTVLFDLIKHRMNEDKIEKVFALIKERKKKKAKPKCQGEKRHEDQRIFY